MSKTVKTNLENKNLIVNIIARLTKPSIDDIHLILLLCGSYYENIDEDIESLTNDNLVVLHNFLRVSEFGASALCDIPIEIIKYISIVNDIPLNHKNAVYKEAYERRLRTPAHS